MGKWFFEWNTHFVWRSETVKCVKISDNVIFLLILIEICCSQRVFMVVLYFIVDFDVGAYINNNEQCPRSNQRNHKSLYDLWDVNNDIRCLQWSRHHWKTCMAPTCTQNHEVTLRKFKIMVIVILLHINEGIGGIHLKLQQSYM